MKNSFIQVDNFTLFIDKQVRLRNLNFSLEKNSILTIIGPTRAGKVNLIRSFNRSNELFHKVEIEGNIYVNGKSIYDNSNTNLNYLRRKHAYIPGNPIIFNGSVWDNLIIGLEIHKIEKKHWYNYIKYALETLESWEFLKDRFDEDINKLSVLEKIIVTIARAIVLTPDLLLFEDFTRNLDSSSFLEFADTFIRLRRKFTILMVCYEFKTAAKLGTYTMLLKEGRLVEINETTKFFSMPEKEETEEFLMGKFD